MQVGHWPSSGVCVAKYAATGDFCCMSNRALARRPPWLSSSGNTELRGGAKLYHHRWLVRIAQWRAICDMIKYMLGYFSLGAELDIDERLVKLEDELSLSGRK